MFRIKFIVVRCWNIYILKASLTSSTVKPKLFNLVLADATLAFLATSAAALASLSITA
jgi:hypothetical protein